MGGGYVRGDSATFDSSDQVTPGEVVELGWALHKNRKPVAFSEKAKSYLVDVFCAGEETGKKDKRLLCRLKNEVFERREWAEDVHKDRLADRTTDCSIL